MCGIAAIVGYGPDLLEWASNANRIQRHRGPDHQAALCEHIGRYDVAVGHQRLSIVDLSDAGAQPMHSRSGRLTIVFNGEVYNFRELITRYGLSDLRSSCDTEVVIELIERLGIGEACKQFNGMWALIVLDREEQRLHISRDRMGKKPLYYCRTDDGLAFASEVKTLLDLAGVEPKINTRVAHSFIVQGRQNASDESWIDGIESFPAASVGFVDLSAETASVSGIRPFWALDDQNIENLDDEAQALDLLVQLVQDAVKLRLEADVPVGVALSGGLDSSIIASIASSSARDVALFSAVSPGSIDDESKYSRMVARHLGRESQEIQFDDYPAEQFQSALSSAIYFNDGPVSSFSPLLFHAMIKKARAIGIKVVVTGQGADEGFCGYRKYPYYQMADSWRQGRPHQAVGQLFDFVRNGALISNFNLAEARRYMPGRRQSFAGEALHGIHPHVPNASGSSGSRVARTQKADIRWNSIPSLCHYEDRMSMASSVEVRSPFLDYRLLELGLRLTSRLKMKNGWTKYPLRRVFEKQLPQEIIWRKDKKGFVNPQDHWFRTKLGDYVDRLMTDDNSPVYADGLVDKSIYRASLAEYHRGAGTAWFREIFAPLSLDLWMREAKSGFASTDR